MTDFARSAAQTAAVLMAAAARTAPKAGGKDFLEIVVLTEGADFDRLAEAMTEYAPHSTNEAFWLRDADNAKHLHALVLIGLKSTPGAGYDCGACGFSTCAEFNKNRNAVNKDMGYKGPHCAMRLIDVGAALASAAKTASILSVDSRVQQRIGAAAIKLGYINADVVLAVPCGVYGKSIFMDRKAPAKKA